MKQHQGSSAEDRRRFLDEMLTWREMAVHFVYYHPDDYDTYDCLPAWAKDSLHDARADPRGQVYTLQELEEGRCVVVCDVCSLCLGCLVGWLEGRAMVIVAHNILYPAHNNPPPVPLSLPYNSPHTHARTGPTTLCGMRLSWRWWRLGT